MNDYYLKAWEENFKKGHLSFWIFTALKESPKDAKEILEFVHTCTESNSTYDEQSVYRSLRKLNRVALISYETKPSSKGPALKKYSLTKEGETLFAKFIERNIKPFYSNKLSNILNK